MENTKRDDAGNAGGCGNANTALALQHRTITWNASGILQL